MSKKSFKIMIGAILIFSLFFLYLVADLPMKEKKTTEPLLPQIEKILNDNDIKTILDRSYFSGAEFAGYSSAYLVNSKFDLYNFYWTLSLIKETAYPLTASVKRDLVSTFYYQAVEVANYESLDDLRLLSGIINILKIDDESIKNRIIKSLMRKYDNTSKFFFNNTNKDPLNDKLVATSIGIQTLNDINYSGDLLLQLKHNLLTTIENEQNLFSLNTNLSQEINNNGGLILQCLDSMRVSIDDFSVDTRNRLNKWLIYWNKQSLEITKFTVTDVVIISNLIDINSFFNKSYVNPTFKENMLNTPNILSQSKLSKTYEPQYISIIIKILNNNFGSYVHLVHDYISQSINIGFKAIIDPVMKFHENYFGIYLAEKSGFTYDKVKVSFLIKNLTEAFLKQRPQIENKNDLANIYYLVGIHDLLHIDLSAKEKIQSLVVSYINNIDLNDKSNFAENIQTVNMTLEILNSIGLEKQQINKIKEKGQLFLRFIEINLNEPAIKKTIDTILSAKVIMIIDLLNEPAQQHKKIIQTCKESIMSLYESGGFKSDKGGMADVVSTFNAVAALSKLNSLDKEIVANILKFTASLKNKDSEIKISKLNDYADLSTIYYAYRLLSLIEIY